MSGLSDFLTTGTFWWGAGAGTVLGASITAGVNFLSTHRSDSRTFDHEDTLDQRRADREQKKSNDELVREAAMDFAEAAANALASSIDLKAAFNALRDQFNWLGPR
jgi:hypothetical protein